MFRTALTILLLLPEFAAAQMQMPACHAMQPAIEATPPAKLPPPRPMTGIGNLHFPISSKNPETQTWFDQGINLIFDFWDYEAERAFEQAVRTDPDCAICHWGLYQAYGSRSEESQAYMHQELQAALALRTRANEREKLYLDVAEAEEKGRLIDKDSPDSDPEKRPGVALLRDITVKYPDDTTAHVLLAMQLMNGYDEHKGPRSGTKQAIAVLQDVLQKNPDSSAAHHIWIHAVEAGPHPDQAMKSAAVLASLAPASGHMTHMPGHIYYRTGDYATAQKSFDLSESVDEAYMRDQHVSVDNDWNYVHNLMYSIANLMELGRMQQAESVSAKLSGARGTRDDTLYPWSPRDAISRLNPQLPVALRTGDWTQTLALLSTAHPPDNMPVLQFMSQALVWYATGMQHLLWGEVDQAADLSTQLDAKLWRLNQQQSDDEASRKDQPPDPQEKVKNHISGPDAVLKQMLPHVSILSLELRAGILVAQKRDADAKKLFADALQEEQQLGYHEPPPFIRPVAEQEAEEWMAAGKFVDARAAWQAALIDRPNSGFALFGLAQAEQQMGDTAAAENSYRQFLQSWATADSGMPQLQQARSWMAAHQAQTAAR